MTTKMLVCGLMTLVTSFLASEVETANILLVVPIAPGLHSHVNKMAELGQALATRGQHKITWLFPDSHHVEDKFRNIPFNKVSIVSRETYRKPQLVQMLWQVQYKCYHTHTWQ